MNDSPSKSLNLEVLLSILRRRIWVAITLFSVVIAVTAGLVKFLPSVYTARTFILIEGQQIPQEYVQSTVTSGIEKRLHTISQQILSRSRLQGLIKQFSLYRDLQKRVPPDEIIAAMRRDVRIEIKGVQSRRSARNTNTVAFEVSYTGADPYKVMMVVNTLASFYIEENLKMRERQALGTSDFLRGELQEVKKRLEVQEQQSASYKRKYLGELPGQLDANLKTLERLQAQLQLVSDNLTRAADRRDSLVRLIEEITRDGSSALNGDSHKGDLAKQIEELDRNLSVLKSRFSDKYPDVMRLKREIAILDEQLDARDEVSNSETNGPTALSNGRPYKARLQAELTELDTMIKLHTAEQKKTQDAISRYQKRIENTPKRGQELLLISRNYDTTSQLYHSLLKRQQEANLASSMERRQKAERFQIIDSAIRPEMPVSPNRMRLLLVGLFLSFVVAGAGVFVLEMTDTSFHRAEDLQTFSKTPILVAIPRIVTRADRWQKRRRRSLGVAALAILLLGVVAGTYYLAKGNEELVKRFTKPNRGLQLRR